MYFEIYKRTKARPWTILDLKYFNNLQTQGTGNNWDALFNNYTLEEQLHSFNNKKKQNYEHGS